MKYHLKNTKEKLIYRNSLFSRCVSFLFLLFFLGGSIDALFRGEKIASLTIPLLISLIALIGTLYIDRWIINKKTLEVKYEFGVIPFKTIKKIDGNEIKKIEITHFVKGSFDENAEYKRKGRAYRAQVRFSIILNNDDKIDVEVIDEKKSGGTCEQAALLFSTELNVPFTKDRERDLDLDVGLRDINKFRN